jgi:hypothetical protein
MTTRRSAFSLFALMLTFGVVRAKPLREAKDDKSVVHFISLLAKANLKLTDGLGSGIAGNSLADLVMGEQTFAKKKFKIEDGLIQLGGLKVKNKPIAVTGIKVGRRFIKLNILQGTTFGSQGEEGDPFFVPDGTLIGEFKVYYEDNTATRIPILYGRHVRDWSDPDRLKSITRGVVAWEGTNPHLKQTGQKIRLYMTTWDNPQPRKLVRHIDYHSANTVCAPFCVAMTAEGDGLTAASPNYYHDFRTADLPAEDLKLIGSGVALLVRSETEGLRITVPPDRDAGPVGVVTRFRIAGDFEITVGYQIIYADRPTTPRGVGFEIFLTTDTPTNEATSFYREVHADGSEVYAVSRMTTIGQGVRAAVPGTTFNRIAAAGRSGQLRLTRKGSNLTYSAADASAKDFRQLFQAVLGAEDVTQLRLGVSTGGPHGIDMRVLDLRIRNLEQK